MSNYFREANIVIFIKQQLENIVQEDENYFDNFKDYIQKLIHRNEEAERTIKILTEKYSLINYVFVLIIQEKTILIEKITNLESIVDSAFFNVVKMNESLTAKPCEKTKSNTAFTNSKSLSDDKFDFEQVLLWII